MLNNYTKRRKAFLGTLIGTGINVASSIIGASAQRRNQEKQYALQRAAEHRNAAFNNASNLTKAYANVNELDNEFQNRFLSYGGRRKANVGIETDVETNTETNNSTGYEWTNNDTSNLISSGLSSIDNLVGGLIKNKVQRPITTTTINPINVGSNNKAVYDSAARSNFLNNYYRTATLRMGGKHKRRC